MADVRAMREAEAEKPAGKMQAGQHAEAWRRDRSNLMSVSGMAAKPEMRGGNKEDEAQGACFGSHTRTRRERV